MFFFLTILKTQPKTTLITPPAYLLQLVQSVCRQQPVNPSVPVNLGVSGSITLEPSFYTSHS